MIDPVAATEIISNFTRTQYVGNNIVSSHVEHLKTRGATVVEEVAYITYNAQGQEESKYEIGSTVDIHI
jgi:hypothetical protein|tara:strand:- start:1889 stop:2095 length:207 start_codon:yes stop_codon:yes gene_type:complete